MDLYLHIAFFFVIFPFIKAQEVFIYSQSPPCFPVQNEDDTQCNSNLANSFQSDYPVSGPNKDPDTKFYLFTTRQSNTAESLDRCGGALPPSTNYNSAVNTEIIIHGNMDGVCRTAWMREMKNRLFKRGDYNVILVDWTWGNGPTFEIAENNSRIVGQQVGFVINNIMKQTDQGPDQFHIIGHSLGAIAASYAGRMVDRKLRRITGLDPSYGALARGPPDTHLTYRDAKIVDVIHSNSDHDRAIGIGDESQLGDADFYPNGGLVQCSCYPYIARAFAIGDTNYALASLGDPRLCFHLQVLQYYKVSINPDKCEFIGLACDSYEDFENGKCNDNPYAVMGMDYELYHPNDTERRKYYLNTCLFYPYYDNPNSLEGRDLPFNSSCTKCNRGLNGAVSQGEADKIESLCLKIYKDYVGIKSIL